MNKVYSSKTKRILDELQHNTRTAKEVFEAIFSTDPDTFKITKRTLGYMSLPKKLTYQQLRRLEQKRFYTLLAKLRLGGIVEKRGIGLSATFALTSRGMRKLLHLSDQPERHSDLPHKTYQKKQSKETILIIFDIPECFKHYRNWIRYQLRLLGFSMLQKSVWIGTYQIPDDFLHDLRECNMLQYIHIFKVTQAGSLLV